MFGGGFSGSNSSSMQNTNSAGSSAGAVFNFGPGASSGGALNQTTLIMLAGVALLAVVLLRKK